MEPNFWLDRWKENEIGFHQDEINRHLQDYWAALEIPAGAKIFVPLCGKTRDMAWLMGQGYRVLGVDLSSIAARDFFLENHIRPEVVDTGRFEIWQSDGIDIICGDIFNLTADDLEDCTGVYDRASLVALPPEMRERYANHVMDILPRPIKILLMTMEYPQAELKGPPFSVEEGEVFLLYQDKFKIECLYEIDILGENKRFQDKGVTQMLEKVYCLGSR